MTESHVTNYSSLVINQQTVETALDTFTSVTEIPVVIVVDSMENVFGKTMPFSDIVTILILLGFIALAIYLIVKAVKNRKNNNNNNNNYQYQQNQNEQERYDYHPLQGEKITADYQRVLIFW